jgi:arylsulfatase A-like enzyme
MLADGITTLAERFAAAGYQTAGFFSGPYLHPAFGLGQGFDHYENCTSYAQRIDRASPDEWAMDPGVMRSSHRDVTNAVVLAAFEKWLGGHGRSKFFMFVHLWDCHFDFIPPAPYDTMFDPDYAGRVTGAGFFFDHSINARMPKRDLEHLIALYDGEIAWTDHHVGMIVEELQQSGLLDGTVVAVTSDHGTEFFEHGGKAHRMTLFDEVIRIPLIVRYPAELPAGVRVGAQTRIIDLGPTLLELAGLPPASDVMGYSLVSLSRGRTPGFDNLAVSELFSVGRRMRTMRTLDWKLFDHLVAKKRYYIQLDRDPGERRPQWDLENGLGPELMNRYQTVARDLALRRTRMPGGRDSSTIPADVREQLGSLGYLEENESGRTDPGQP